jgi:uncharacterized SAM-binding protein YcdF (DUF218 family)
MVKIIQFVFSVGGLVTVLIGVVVWLRLRPASRWARRWLVSITVFYTLASVYAVPHGAARLIAHGYHAFRAADVPASRILLESESENTHDEVVLVAPMLAARQIDRVILVTSDVHMRRSIGTFHAVGIEAIPAIAQDPAWVPSWRGWLLPSPLGLETSSGVAHEIAGFAGYAVRGPYR